MYIKNEVNYKDLVCLYVFEEDTIGYICKIDINHKRKEITIIFNQHLVITFKTLNNVLDTLQKYYTINLDEYDVNNVCGF